jgi:hypothetical protein
MSITFTFEVIIFEEKRQEEIERGVGRGTENEEGRDCLLLVINYQHVNSLLKINNMICDTTVRIIKITINT